MICVKQPTGYWRWTTAAAPVQTQGTRRIAPIINRRRRRRPGRFASFLLMLVGGL